jgi:hypothetical protein
MRSIVDGNISFLHGLLNQLQILNSGAEGGEGIEHLLKVPVP